ncbi:DUF418 domain-containing protein [Actinopolymorpha sp. B9G3]|uniref:DUF418 domain-containing protein n=1 Tax=Actinopolymorpha sp. B9G3 TaxID=3158970 RepID=UPI0032D8E104
MVDSSAAVHASPTPPRAAGPTALAARSLAPDLARGLMLLFIALANTHTFLHLGGWNVRAHPHAGGGSALDATVSAVLTVFVDGRSYPMFAALFGYGLVQIMRKQERAGLDWPQTRKLLRRRGWWLVVFGVLHATLLFYGDILTSYGLIAVVLVGSLRAQGRGLAIRLAVWLTLGSLVYGLFSLPVDESAEQFAGPMMLATIDDPLVAMGYRALMILFSGPVIAVTAAGAVLLGAWAARRRILEEPERHLRLLRRTAAVGITVAAVGGLPLALQTADLLPISNPAVFVSGTLHALTGYAGGLGYAAAIALFAVRLGERRGPLVNALAATGQRSLTCYLLQSLVWYVAFMPFLLDLGTRVGVTVTSVLAICTWAMTVVVADLMRRAGQRGPFEVVLRRLVYRRP